MFHYFLAVVVLIAIFIVFRLLRKLPTQDIAALLLIFGILTVSTTTFYLTITGKLPVIFAVFAIFWPILFHWFKNRKPEKKTDI